ncbi:MAG: ABC transporter ATP-binding protein [Trueperella sp.]|uniref:ABC transporter ATP-binding protein n=1 Tax=Trueperella sp. TaxID=2699835 RepID=UPI002A91D12A|nr:ABC transporter ATP-binding protein [Trueperella sp.]MDY5404439.1 ABC transporter ATP-binding protein [Trueperella sp.]
MWIREVLTDPPARAWAVISASWARTLFLALAAVATGKLATNLWQGSAWIVPLLAVVALVLAAALSAAIAELVPSRIQSAEESHWRARILSSALAGTLKAPARRGPPVSGDGATVDAAMSGAERIAGYRAGFLAPTLASFTAPVIVLAVWAIWVDWVSALVLGAFVALVPLIIMTAGKLLRGSNHEYRMKEAQATNRYVEMIEGIGTIKVLGGAARARDEFAASARASMASLGTLLVKNQRMIIANDLIFGFLMTGLGLILLLSRAREIGPGGVIAAVLLLVLLHEPIDRVGRTFYIGLGGRARREQVDQMLGEEFVPRATAVPEQAAYELAGLTVSLGGRPILTDISLSIPAGAHVALVGPTGAGKTTLLKVLAGLVEAPGVTLNGQVARAAELRAAATLVSQRAGILSTTIGDNLSLVGGLSEAEKAELLAQAHLDLADFPQGLDTSVGQSGALLSGGQRRRLILARAMSRPRPALLLDEATADLDRQTEARIRAELARLGQGRTVVQVAHRLDMVADADLIVVLEHGRITDQGSPAELAARPGFYAAALDAEVTRG